MRDDHEGHDDADRVRKNDDCEYKYECEEEMFIVKGFFDKLVWSVFLSGFEVFLVINI